MKITFLALCLAAWGAMAADAPVPLFEYRVLQSAFRKSPTNTDAVVAETLRNILPEDIRPFAAVSLSLSVAGWNYRDGDTPLDFCKRFDRQGVKFFVEIADPGIPDPPNQRRWFTAAELREIFAACTNCAGADTGETFWAFTGKDNPKISTGLLVALLFAPPAALHAAESEKPNVSVMIADDLCCEAVEFLAWKVPDATLNLSKFISENVSSQPGFVNNSIPLGLTP